MTEILRITLVIALVAYFVLIFYLLHKQKIILKYTLLWLLFGCIFTIMVVFPQVLTIFTRVMGFELPINGLFAGCVFFILILLMSITGIVSKQNEKIKSLIQYCAMLEKRIRELEERNN